MSSIKLSPNASGTGEFTIAAPNSNSNYTLTLPTTAGTLFTNPNGAVDINAGAPASSLTISATGVVGGNGSSLTSLNASNLASGTVPDARFPATLPAASGANLTSLNASNLSTGTVGTARLATGTANSTTFLRGDQTWATVSGGVTSLNGQTGAITDTSVDAIGSYIAAVRGVNISASQNTLGTIGETIAGSSLRYGFTNSSAAGDFDAQYNGGSRTYDGGGTALSGTWRLMARDRRRDQCGAGQWYPGLWVRIS